MTRVLCLLVAAIGLLEGTQTADRARLADLVTSLTRESSWKLVAAVPLAFTAHHPQGLVKIGETLFLSSVEITTPTRRLPRPVGGHDRDTGAGVGHLFKFDRSGRLIADLRLGEGAQYHPGGIDYDGTYIWVPVAEYRPNSRSIVYRVEPGTMTATEMFRTGDHIGAVVHDTDEGTLHGVSWGSRRFYRWSLGGDGRVTGAAGAATPPATRNPSHYVDYQDCKYVSGGLMLCTGISELQRPAGAAAFRLGGLELVDLRDGRPRHQVPLLLWTPGGLPLTRNATWFEPTATGLRGYFVPEDDKSVLYIYEHHQAGSG